MGEPKKASEDYTKARSARRTTFNALTGSSVTPRIQSEFLFEYLTSELHAAQLGFDDGDVDTNDIVEQIRHFLAKNSRAIGRAIGALESYAVKYDRPALLAKVHHIKSAISSG
jgi:hypothetical protein